MIGCIEYRPARFEDQEFPTTSSPPSVNSKKINAFRPKGREAFSRGTTQVGHRMALSNIGTGNLPNPAGQEDTKKSLSHRGESSRYHPIWPEGPLWPEYGNTFRYPLPCNGGRLRLGLLATAVSACNSGGNFVGSCFGNAPSLWHFLPGKLGSGYFSPS